MREAIMLRGLLAALLLVAGGAAATHAPDWEAAFSDAFEREELGPDWLVLYGDVAIENGSVRMSRDHGFARLHYEADRTLGDGALEFSWHPGRVASAWKEFYVHLRGDEANDESHAVLLRPEQGDVCFDHRMTESCRPFAWDARWYDVNVTHVGGDVSVAIDGSVVLSGRYAPSEEVTYLLFGARDDGSGQRLDNVSYARATHRTEGWSRSAGFDWGTTGTPEYAEGEFGAARIGPREGDPRFTDVDVRVLSSEYGLASVYAAGHEPEAVNAETPGLPGQWVRLEAGAHVRVLHESDAGAYVCLVETLPTGCVARYPADGDGVAWVTDDAHAARVSVLVTAAGEERLDVDEGVPAGGVLMPLLP